ncbi:hypothetical protein BH09BAC5_BH09BAC5_05800 [soil metagenome]
MELDMNELNKIDPLKRHVEKSLDSEEQSPFDPPDAYAPSTLKGISLEDMHPAIQQLMLDHVEVLKITTAFEKALVDYKNNGYKLEKEINDAFGTFFKFFDNKLLLHNAKEDKYFFPVLEKHMLATGEHAIGENPMTAIDIMEDDHQRFIQLGALCFNLFGLAMRLPDQASRLVLLDAGFDNGRELVELLKLHIYREDYTLFPMAMKLMSKEELDFSEVQMKKMK